MKEGVMVLAMGMALVVMIALAQLRPNPAQVCTATAYDLLSLQYARLYIQTGFSQSV
jgi:hypothetical protein